MRFTNYLNVSAQGDRIFMDILDIVPTWLAI